MSFEVFRLSKPTNDEMISDSGVGGSAAQLCLCSLNKRHAIIYFMNDPFGSFIAHALIRLFYNWTPISLCLNLINKYGSPKILKIKYRLLMTERIF